jgi:DNA-3-methyladenine glycosylase II
MSFIKLDPIIPVKGAETAVTAQLRLPPSIDFGRQLSGLRDSGAHDLLDEFGSENDHAWLERPIRLNEQSFLLRLTVGASDDSALLVQLRLQADDDATDPPSEDQVQEAVAFAAQRFSWELDMEAVREVLSVNEYGAELVARFWPLHPSNLAGPWEGLLKTVISNQIYPGLAVRLQQALLDNYGENPTRFNGRTYKFYPSAERLAEVDPGELIEMRFSRQKASYLPGIARMLLDQPDKFNWARLRGLPGPEAVAVLDELPGVGPWTAHYVAMRGLSHLDVFIDETGLRKLLAHHFDRRAELSSEEATKLTAVYAPYRSLACYYSYMLLYAADQA